MRKILVVSVFVFFLLIPSALMAQKVEAWQDPGAAYRIALELFEREKYGSARKIFEQLSAETSGEMKSISEYYAAVCAYKTLNQDAGTRLSAFIRANPASPKINQARFYQGNFLFNSRSYKTAAELYSQVDAFELPGSELPEFYFKAGYARYATGNSDGAKNYFFEVKDGRNPYAPQASYYYGHILYTEGKYENALREFNKLLTDNDYKSLIPFYITQIYYRQGKYEELLQVAPPLLDQTSGQQKGDIARMIGDSYFRQEKYSQAYDYLLIHKQFAKGGTDRRQAYALAYAAYKAGKTEDAIGYFQIAANGKDSLANNAWYHLGDCYLKTGKKEFAQNAFYTAYQLSYDQTTREDALFNYAKLSYELASDPYNEAISALKKYLAEYPGSRRADEANQYLVNLALNSRNYSEALSAIENIRNMDPKMKAAYQKILYLRGIEVFQAGKFSEASGYLERATEMDHDRSIRPQALYWMAEAHYRRGEYNSALAGYNKFLVSRGAIDLPEYSTVHYAIGYAYYKLNNTDQASVAFRKFASSYRGPDKALLNDAYLRIGDCFFIARNYPEAIAYYDRVLNSNGADSDYALYQKSMAQGVQREFSGKIGTLNTLVSKFPRSPYVPGAYYEMALTSLIINKNEDALNYLQQIILKFPKSNMVSRAHLRRGLIYYNDNQNQAALGELKTVVSKYPGTPDAREALMTISNIYVEMNRVSEYLAYVQTVPFAEVPVSQQDSLLFVAAETQYMKGDCKSSAPGFQEYVRKNPQGGFAIPSWFYIAECARRQGDADEALRAYEEVAARPGNKFIGRALLHSAALRFRKNDYRAALRHYVRLEAVATDKNAITEALAGQMRCFYLTGDYDSTLYASARLLTSEKVTQEMLVDAHLHMGRAAFATQNLRLAEKEFTIVTRLTQNVQAAEAQYFLAQMAFERNDLGNAEKLTFSVINNYPSADYWRVKSFLLLADIYAANGNIFQARQTLQSIIDNYEGEDLRALARQKLSLLPSTN